MTDGHPPASSASKPPVRATCFVTGATGFIGGHLAQRLVREGHRVRCLVRATSDTSLVDTLDVELAVGDLTSLASLLDAVEDCRYVFHCGAFVSDWATTQEIAATNAMGTRHVLEASVASGVERFIHFSTTDVYGYPGGVAIDETYQSTRFRNWYAQTKLEAEAEVRRATAAQPIAAVILRPATVYGPRSKEVVGEIARAIRNRSMLLIDGGRAVAGLCYVENLIDAALVALDHRNAPGQAFNVSDGLGVTWKQFTQDIARGLGCPPPRFSMPYGIATAVGFSLEHSYRLLRRASGLTTPPLLSRQAVHVMGSDQDFSNRKARKLLGWEPRIDYETGLRATIQWLQAEHFSHA
ncbi:MAG: NAD-dependent epimerase/dehydratase family protein [Chloroflexi bacterium]|nr:NAD-dependent epimerase/dehydratase family protein [Chloroflexota bacterium]